MPETERHGVCESSTGQCELQLFPMAVEQDESGLMLEVRDVPADSGLGHAYFFGAPGQVAVPRRRLEHREGIERGKRCLQCSHDKKISHDPVYSSSCNGPFRLGSRVVPQ